VAAAHRHVVAAGETAAPIVETGAFAGEVGLVGTAARVVGRAAEATVLLAGEAAVLDRDLVVDVAQVRRHRAASPLPLRVIPMKVQVRSRSSTAARVAPR
jgi:hypothetical protein